MADVEIDYRPITTRDMAFLFEVYASTRTEELAQTPWSDEQKTAFLRHQFTAQHTHYQTYFARADFLIILLDGVAAGRLYVDRAPTEVRVIDISILPEHRGQGLGGTILRGLLDEAAAAGKPVRVHVLKDNPTERLYRSLGFRELEDRGAHLFMEWRR